jgi:hypothetical protein
MLVTNILRFLALFGIQNLLPYSTRICPFSYFESTACSPNFNPNMSEIRFSLSLGLPDNQFSNDFPTKILYEFLIALTSVSFSIHPRFKCLIIINEEYTSLLLKGLVDFMQFRYFPDFPQTLQYETAQNS